MKNLKLRKLVAVALAVMTIATVSPIGASAAWKQDSNGWWNTEGSSWSIGWRNINGSWYDFGSDGYMKTGWVNDGGTWYYTAPSGAMQTGWVNDKGTWYYTAPSGAMQTGWVNDKGTWYFTASSGAMQTGVVEVEGKTYYLAPSGAMATGTVTIAGETYTFAASGEAIGDKIPTPTVAFTSAGTAVTPTNPISTGTTTTDTTTTSSSGGGSSSGGITTTDVTGIVSDALVNSVNNHPTLAKNISVTPGTAGSPIVVTIKNANLNSLKSVFEKATNENFSQIKDRLVKVQGIMDSYSKMVNVGGFTFEQYLAQAEPTYFNADGLKIDTIATRIDNDSLGYVNFKTELTNRLKAMDNAPEVSISYGSMSVTVTKIQKDETVIYDAGSSMDKYATNLVDLGDDITGTYTVNCKLDGINGFFRVTVTE